MMARDRELRVMVSGELYDRLLAFAGDRPISDALSDLLDQAEPEVGGEAEPTTPLPVACPVIRGPDGELSPGFTVEGGVQCSLEEGHEGDHQFNDNPQ